MGKLMHDDLVMWGASSRDFGENNID